ncbi:MAG: nitroreductase family protein [Chloroflexi bacterium]|nr:nitroreductase family protein [Chloroflexota bacterium]
MTIDLSGTRFSVRQFLDKPIPGQIVQAILEAGRLSPSGGNEQPWKFGVITEKPLIAQISEIASPQKWIAQAPLLIL